MKTAIIIPARYASTRLPGKPLQIIGDKPMILHVAKQASLTKGVDEVWIATDHNEIYDIVRHSGYQVVMTSANHQTGTDRIAEANQKINADIVVNIQGDEPFINPKTIELALHPLFLENGFDMSTLATPFENDADVTNPNYVKVVTDQKNKALYFSRSVIPFPRDNEKSLLHSFSYMRHIGIYVYRKNVLDNLSKLTPTPIELAEKLEQLRALYYGYSIAVVRVNDLALSVDTPDDLEKARHYYATTKN